MQAGSIENKNKNENLNPTPIPTLSPSQASQGMTTDEATVSKLADLVKLQKTSTALNKKMALELTRLQKSTEDLKNLQKKSTNLFIFVIVTTVIILLYKILIIYIKYKQLISICNSAKAQNYWPVSGLETAIAIEYPALSGWMGFYNKALPVAVMYFIYDPSDFGITNLSSNKNIDGPDGSNEWSCQDLANDPTKVLYVLYQASLRGSGTDETQQPSVIELICGSQGQSGGSNGSYGNACNANCRDQNCQGLSTSDYVNIGMSAVGGVANGTMISHGFGMTSTGGNIFAMVATAALTVGLTYLQTEQQNKATQDAAGCNGNSSTI
jgi:hypothetical protein